MKFFIVVILAVICGTAMCGKSEWDAMAMQCSQKHNVKVEDMKDVLMGNKVAEADVTPDMKCFTLCMAEKENFIKDGAFQPQVFAEKLKNADDKEFLAKITSECNLKGADDCDTAFKVISCLAKNKKQKM